MLHEVRGPLRVNKNIPGICEAVLSVREQMQFSPRNTQSTEVSSSENPVLQVGLERALLSSAGREEKGKGEGGKCGSNPVVFVLTCFLKCEGVVVLEINGKTGGGEGKQVVHSLCCHQLPQHTCSKEPTWASLVAAAASLSCGSWSSKGGVWIIPRIPAVPLVSLVRFVQRHRASLAWWLQQAFSLFERSVTGDVTAQRKGGL